jgi:hypothetical protein
MFSFNQVKERFVSPHVYSKKEEDEDQNKNEAESMDTNPVDEAPFSQFVFPLSQYEVIIQHPQHFYVKGECIPPTLLPLSPNAMNGLSSIDNLTGIQKATSCVYTALPIPVHHSPLVALFLDNMPKECRTRPRKHRYINWIQSVYQLRSFIPLILQFAIPFHSSVTNEYPQECFDEFTEQMRVYEEMHQQRVAALFYNSDSTNNSNNNHHTPQALATFIEYCVDFSYYYIHSLERFIFKVVVEPHTDTLLLEHILTPHHTNISVLDCENKQAVLKCVVDFFELKVLATQKYDQRYAGEDYVFRNPIQYSCVESRIRSIPPNQLYMGCIDTQTILEYLEFCNPNINLK